MTPAQGPGPGRSLPPSSVAGLLHWVLAVSAAQPVTFRSRGAGCWRNHLSGAGGDGAGHRRSDSTSSHPVSAGSSSCWCCSSSSRWVRQGSGEHVGHVDEPHGRVAAVQRHPRCRAGRAGGARVEGGGRDLEVMGRSCGGDGPAGGLLAAGVRKQNRSGIVSARLVRAFSASPWSLAVSWEGARCRVSYSSRNAMSVPSCAQTPARRGGAGCALTAPRPHKRLTGLDRLILRA